MEYQNPSDYSPSNLNRLLDELIKERSKPLNKKSLIKLFNKYGICLVIEEPLDGTEVRGCTKIIGNNPAIYMTCYLKSLHFTLPYIMK